MLASLTQVLVGLLLRFIGPLTLATTISLVGLSLVPLATELAQTHWGISIGTTCCVFLYGLFLGRFQLPFPSYNTTKKCHMTTIRLFQQAPVILSIITMWIFSVILTTAGVFPNNSTQTGYEARTDTGVHMLTETPWISFPYPGQFGWPSVSVAGYVGMLAATISSVIESVGDYFAAAHASEVANPPSHAVNRGIAVEGIGCIMAGSVGAVHGITSYSENVAAILVTKIASRRIFLTAGLVLVFCGTLGKFGALVTLIPTPIIGGVAIVTLGMVTMVGLSTLQRTDLSSPSNLMVVGTSIMIGLTVPRFVSSGKNIINTGSTDVDHVLTVVIGSPMFLGGVLVCILDNLLPGTTLEKGLTHWRTDNSQLASSSSKQMLNIYDIPFITPFLKKHSMFKFVPISPSFGQ